MKKEIFDSALLASQKLNNLTIQAISHEERRLIIALLKAQEEIKELEKRIKEMKAQAVKLFLQKGVPFTHDGAGKSTCRALSYREGYARHYVVYREGESQETVDYASFAKSLGETPESIKAQGFFSVRKGTTTVGAPNKSQLLSLMALFADEND